MKIKRITYLFLLFIVVSILSSCAFITKSTTRKQIVTTLYPEYDMIMKIIGDNEETKNLFDVTLIIPPGQDSHTYDPSIRNLITIKSADLFIYTADEMETWVKDIEFSEKTKVINLSDDDRIELVKASEEDAHLTQDYNGEEEPGHDHTHIHEYDPHYWIYPIYATYMVEQIRDALIEILQDPYPEKPITNVIYTNASEYIKALKEIDQEIKDTVQLAKETTKRNTMYFGSPFSFYYWHVFYGLEYRLTYATCSTESEPSIEVLTSIIREMKENDVDVIFAKELINQEACEMIRFHTNAKILVMHSGHNVSATDFYDPQVSYLTILRNDVDNLKQMLKVNHISIGGDKE